MRAFSIGPKMIAYLEKCGYQRLDEFSGKDPQQIILEIEIECGVRLNRMGLDALSNLVDLAKSERKNP